VRKSKIVEIDQGRDKGKKFLVQEMPVFKAEKWAIRALQAIAAAGIDIPEGYTDMPSARLAEAGLKALANIKWEVAEPLLDELMTCMLVVMPDAQTRKLLESDIEEVLTLFTLRKEVVSMHMGFFTKENS
jgi:hypothetical protein